MTVIRCTSRRTPPPTAALAVRQMPQARPLQLPHPHPKLRSRRVRFAPFHTNHPNCRRRRSSTPKCTCTTHCRGCTCPCIPRALTTTPRKEGSDLHIPQHTLAHFGGAKLCHSTVRLPLISPSPADDRGRLNGWIWVGLAGRAGLTSGPTCSAQRPAPAPGVRDAVVLEGGTALPPAGRMEPHPNGMSRTSAALVRGDPLGRTRGGGGYVPARDMTTKCFFGKFMQLFLKRGGGMEIDMTLWTDHSRPNPFSLPKMWTYGPKKTKRPNRHFCRISA